jgi:hypothetical protein
MRLLNGVQTMPQTSTHAPFRAIRRNSKYKMDALKRMIIALLRCYCGVSMTRYRFLSSIRHLNWVSARTVQVAAFSAPSALHKSKLYLLDPTRQRCRFDRTGSVFVSRNINPSFLGSSRNNGVGGYDPSEGIEVSERIKEKSNVGNPQIQVREKEFSVTSILKELAAIQQQGPQKYCILGTRHCSYLHQQIIELLYVF